jgi:hypothetical protein
MKKKGHKNRLLKIAKQIKNGDKGISWIFNVVKL